MYLTVVPYVPGMLHPATERWAREHDARLVEIQPDDTEGYWRLLVAEWAQPGDLVIVEQDILPAPGVVAEMVACRRPWCTSPYPITIHGHLVRTSLGCVKFAARLKIRHPDLMRRLGEVADTGLPARDWRRLDVRLGPLLEQLRYRAHAHRRSNHLHDYRR